MDVLVGLVKEHKAHSKPVAKVATHARANTHTLTPHTHTLTHTTHTITTTTTTTVTHPLTHHTRTATIINYTHTSRVCPRSYACVLVLLQDEEEVEEGGGTLTAGDGRVAVAPQKDAPGRHDIAAETIDGGQGDIAVQKMEGDWGAEGDYVPLTASGGAAGADDGGDGMALCVPPPHTHT